MRIIWPTKYEHSHIRCGNCPKPAIGKCFQSDCANCACSVKCMKAIHKRQGWLMTLGTIIPFKGKNVIMEGL